MLHGQRSPQRRPAPAPRVGTAHLLWRSPPCAVSHKFQAQLPPENKHCLSTFVTRVPGSARLSPGKFRSNDVLSLSRLHLFELKNTDKGVWGQGDRWKVRMKGCRTGEEQVTNQTREGSMWMKAKQRIYCCLSERCKIYIYVCCFYDVKVGSGWEKHHASSQIWV